MFVKFGRLMDTNRIIFNSSWPLHEAGCTFPVLPTCKMMIARQLFVCWHHFYIFTRQLVSALVVGVAIEDIGREGIKHKTSGEGFSSCVSQAFLGGKLNVALEEL